MSARFSNFFDIESAAPAVNSPPAVHQKGPGPPSAVELDELAWGVRYSGPNTTHDESQTPRSGNQNPHLIRDSFVSRPLTPKEHDTIGFAQTWSNPYMNKWRVLSVCLVYLGNGMNDSAPGALLPYMERWYHIGYALVSLVFVGQAVGYIVAAFCNDFIVSHLGRAKALMLSELLITAGYVLIVCTPPFPVVVIGYLVVGYGTSINLALGQVFCSTFANATVILGFTNGFYGIGGTVGPIIATAMVSHGITWSRYYLITLGIRLMCCGFSGWAFWNHEKEASTSLLTASERTASHQAALESEEPSKRRLLARTLRNRVTLLGALFTFAYQGAEVSISGWVISFLITYRHGDPAHVGYVTAGFWGGITLGRFTLSHVASRVGEKRFVYCLGVGAIAFQILVWLIPNIVGDAVAVALLGLLLGPVSPCSNAVFLRLIPRRLQTTSISFVFSVGSSGGAVAPFLTGLVAQAVGTYVLHPICIGLFVLMLVCWFALPRIERRME